MKTDIQLAIGPTYRQKEALLRVIAIHDERALLEEWQGDKLIQYIVSHSFFFVKGDLHWRGSGAYFICSYPNRTDPPFKALAQALDYFQDMSEPKDSWVATDQRADLSPDDGKRCDECGWTTKSEREDMYLINRGFLDQQWLCRICFDSLITEKCTECESCRECFTYNHLIYNKDSPDGDIEICPYCGQVWCE